MLRKLRAIVLIAVAWGLIWLPAGFAFGLVQNSGPSFDILLPGPAWYGLAFLTWGAMSGGGFAVLIALAESGRTVPILSVRRIALWGALGSMTVPIAITVFDIATGPWSLSSYDWIPVLLVLALSAVLGGTCAAGTLLVSRRAT